MKEILGSFVVLVILTQMIRDGLNVSKAVVVEKSPAVTAIAVTASEPKSAVLDPFETSAAVTEGCSDPGVAGRYLLKKHRIMFCTPVIEQKALALGVSAADLKRYILAHEAAHSRGELSEQVTDVIAVKRLAAAGDYAALRAYGAIPSNGTVYDFGRRYAEKTAQLAK